MEGRFVEDGGYSETLAKARMARREQGAAGDGPACPLCGGLMALRTARSGKNKGSQIWG